jgi:hypothetical protein
LHLNEDADLAVEGSTRNDLVIVHVKDGPLVKGVLRWHAPSGDGALLPQLPSVLHIQPESQVGSSTVRLADAKAVFFVRTLEGNAEYEDVKFYSGCSASNMWIRVRLFDGEALEGRTENNISLLVEPGFWLRPTDNMANNLLVYVPKSSAVDFQVMGFASEIP